MGRAHTSMFDAAVSARRSWGEGADAERPKDFGDCSALLD